MKGTTDSGQSRGFGSPATLVNNKTVMPTRFSLGSGLQRSSSMSSAAFRSQQFGARAFGNAANMPNSFQAQYHGRTESFTGPSFCDSPKIGLGSKKKVGNQNHDRLKKGNSS